MCWGADCAHAPAKIVEEAVAEESVSEALEEKRQILGYLPRYLYLVPSVRCNQRCYYCYCYNGHRGKSERSFFLSDHLMEELKRDIIPVADYVILSGGEPFAAPESVGFIEWLIQTHPKKRLLIFTNGSLIHRFGIERLMRPTIKLRISLPAMSENVYRAVTGTDNFQQVMRNLKDALQCNAAHIIVYFVLSKESVKDLEAFCSFIEQHPAIKVGLIQPNYYSGWFFHKRMRTVQKKYEHIKHRLIFIFRNQDMIQRCLRAFYNPVHTLRYAWWLQRQNTDGIQKSHENA